MSETVSFREVKMEGGWLMVKPVREDLGKAMAVVRKHKDKLYDLVVKEHRKKRSLDANAYFWVLADKLAKETRIPKEEIYREAIRNIGGNSDMFCAENRTVEKFCRLWEQRGLGWITDTVPSKLPGCTNIICYYGSSTYDTDQMSRLIDNIVQDCKAVGIETMSQDKLEALLNDWT